MSQNRGRKPLAREFPAGRYPTLERRIAWIRDLAAASAQDFEAPSAHYAAAAQLSCLSQVESSGVCLCYRSKWQPGVLARRLKEIGNSSDLRSQPPEGDRHGKKAQARREPWEFR